VEGQAGNAASVMVHTVLPVFVVGLIFSILWDRYRRLVPLIALHWGVDVLPMMSTMFNIHV
jgi:membrane protease YdiL (CAAX protease family)